MATTARFNRKVAPKASTKTAAPVTPTSIKASFFARAKATVVATAKRVVTFVKTQARKVSSVARVVVAHVKPIAKRAWTVALRPFLGGILAGASVGVVAICVVVAPVTTILGLVVLGGAFVLCAKVVKRLEDTEAVSSVSRHALRILEGIAQVVRAIAYTAAALLAIGTCMVSPAFAVFSALALTFTYFDVRGGGTIAFLAWCALSGSWALGLLWLMWRGATRLAVEEPAVDVVDVPEYSAIRWRAPVEYAHTLYATHVAVGTEEVADLVESESWDKAYKNAQACDACGTDKGAMRIRSNAVPFTTATGPNFGQPHEASSAMLCSDCYDAECEDNAIALTGVSLRKRSVNVVLNVVGRAALPEAASSKADVTQVFWATTAWWRDRRGHHHDRQWDCFHDGKVVASVTYDHQRKVYRASAFGKFLGTKTGLTVAQRLATDTLFDESNAVTRIVEALSSVTVAAS